MVGLGDPVLATVLVVALLLVRVLLLHLLLELVGSDDGLLYLLLDATVTWWLLGTFSR